MIGDKDVKRSGIQCSSRVSVECTDEVEMGQFLSSIDVALELGESAILFPQSSQSNARMPRTLSIKKIQ